MTSSFNSVYVITGGNSGIGQALSWRLAQENNYVIVIGRRKKTLSETCKVFPEHMRAITADIGKEAGRKKIVDALASVKKITGLIHAAGIVQPISPLDAVSLKQWRTIQAINVEAPLFLTQQLLPQLREGRILMISTQVAHVAQPSLAPYCVSKAALHMLYQCFNLDFASYGISASSMTPGIVQTPMFAEIAQSNRFPPTHLHFYQEVIRKNAWIQPAVVAHFIQWLLCSLDAKAFVSQEWDIYDTHHHKHWVKDFPAPQSPGFA